MYISTRRSRRAAHGTANPERDVALEQCRRLRLSTSTTAADTDGSHSSGNGVNEMYFSSADTGSALAVTLGALALLLVLRTQTGLDETDIAFTRASRGTRARFSLSNTGRRTTSSWSRSMSWATRRA